MQHADPQLAQLMNSIPQTLEEEEQDDFTSFLLDNFIEVGTDAPAANLLPQLIDPASFSSSPPSTPSYNNESSPDTSPPHITVLTDNIPEFAQQQQWAPTTTQYVQPQIQYQTTTQHSFLPAGQMTGPPFTIATALDGSPLMGNPCIYQAQNFTQLSQPIFPNSPHATPIQQHFGTANPFLFSQQQVYSTYTQMPSPPVSPSFTPTDQAGNVSTPATTQKKTKPKLEPGANGVLLSREELLNLSSKAMEKYIVQLKEAKAISREEEKQLKKQRRLIKNREYAQTARRKKKTHVGEIEEQVAQLQSQNAQLQSEVVLLNSKIMALTAENTNLRATLTAAQAQAQASQFSLSSGSPSPLPTSMPVAYGTSLPHKKKRRTSSSSFSLWPTSNAKIAGGAGAVLCAVLFFAAFFNPEFLNNNLSQPVTVGVRGRNILHKDEKPDIPYNINPNAHEDVPSENQDNQLTEDRPSPAGDDAICEMQQVCKYGPDSNLSTDTQLSSTSTKLSTATHSDIVEAEHQLYNLQRNVTVEIEAR